MAKSVFYSFHYQRDAWRVQQIIQMGALDGQPVLSAQEWEAVKRKGKAAIEEWIHGQMSYKSAVVVLVGAQTAGRPWVQYEIVHAWNNKKPLVGVCIHGLTNRDGNTDSAGENPFKRAAFQDGGTVGDYVPLFTPRGRDSNAVYADIKANLATWVARAYKRS